MLFRFFFFGLTRIFESCVFGNDFFLLWYIGYGFLFFVIEFGVFEVLIVYFFVFGRLFLFYCVKNKIIKRVVCYNKVFVRVRV